MGIDDMGVTLMDAERSRQLHSPKKFKSVTFQNPINRGCQDLGVIVERLERVVGALEDFVADLTNDQSEHSSDDSIE